MKFFCCFNVALAITSLANMAFANPVPIPSAEAGLPQIRAEEFIQASPDRHTLEGAIFDKEGNLYFCNVSDKTIYRLDEQKKLTPILKLPDLAPGGLAFGQDGRLYLAALDLDKKQGAVLAYDFAETTLKSVIPVEAGYMPNDLVFDKQGGFYFSDFKGSATDAKGGVYYVTPDFKQVIPVIPKMAQANGVALSPDNKTLWATEYAANRLHRISLKNPVESLPTGSKVPYHFIGPAPDSMRVDAAGNVYVAIMGQGRVLIFNKNGLPIAQILLPEREKGNYLRSASLALHPTEKATAIVSGNTPEASAKDAKIFMGPALAPSF